MASYVPCKKNSAAGLIFYVGLVSQADTKLFKASPTLAGGDVVIALDDAAPGNLGTLPVFDADFTKRVKVTLSQAETNADNLTIIFSDAAGAEWCDLVINIQTATQTLDETDAVVDEVLVDTAVIGALGAGLTALSTQASVNTIDGIVDDILVDTAVIGALGAGLTALATQTSVNTIDGIVDDILVDTAVIGALGAGLTALATQTSVNTIDDFIDTEVGAIKGVTDKVDSALVLDGAVYQFTANALELAPTGGSAPTAAQNADAVWDEAIADHAGAGSTGLALANALQAHKGKHAIVGTQLIFYDSDGTTALYTFNLTNSVGSPSATRVYTRTPV